MPSEKGGNRVFFVCVQPARARKMGGEVLSESEKDKKGGGARAIPKTRPLILLFFIFLFFFVAL